MRIILENAQDPDTLLEALNNYGATALQIAAFHGSEVMCSLMLSYARDAQPLLKQVNGGGNSVSLGCALFMFFLRVSSDPRPPLQLAWRSP